MARSPSAAHLVLIRPAPGPDEVFSSWITRVALSNGLRPPGLLLALGTGQVLQGDPDLSLPDSVLRQLAAWTGQPEELVRETSLRPLITPESGGTPLVSSRAFLVFQGRGNGGPRVRGHPVCLACLTESGQLQRRWRLITTVVCPKHGVALTDRCPGCGHPINPLRAQMARATRRKLPTVAAPHICLRCLQLMRASTAPAHEVSEAALALQGWTDTALQGHPVNLRDIQLPAKDFIGLLTVLLATVGQDRARHGRRLQFTPAYDVQAVAGTPLLGLFTPEQRLPIMARCGRLLLAGLVPLLWTLLEADLGPRDLLVGQLGTLLNPWLHDLLSDTLSRRPHARRLVPAALRAPATTVRFAEMDWLQLRAGLPETSPKVHGASRRLDDRVVLGVFLSRALAGTVQDKWKGDASALTVYRRLRRLHSDDLLDPFIERFRLLLEDRLGAPLPGSPAHWAKLNVSTKNQLLALLAPETIRALHVLGSAHAHDLWAAGTALSVMGAREYICAQFSGSGSDTSSSSLPLV
ncbi:TniQ family protein [Deinococcus sp. UYEF24]